MNKMISEKELAIRSLLFLTYAKHVMAAMLAYRQISFNYQFNFMNETSQNLLKISLLRQGMNARRGHRPTEFDWQLRCA